MTDGTLDLDPGDSDAARAAAVTFIAAIRAAHKTPLVLCANDDERIFQVVSVAVQGVLGAAIQGYPTSAGRALAGVGAGVAVFLGPMGAETVARGIDHLAVGLEAGSDQALRAFTPPSQTRQ